jgi:cytochrome P450
VTGPETRTGVAFDHTSSALAGPEYWDAVRELQRQGALTWVVSNGGFWAATTYDTVLRLAQDWETFSSAEGVALLRASPDVVPYIMPVDIDPPRQRGYRKQVNPHLTPKVVAEYEEEIRGIADELIDTFIDRSGCNLATDFARKFPGTVFFRLVARSTDEEFRKVEPSARVISFESDDPEKFAQAAANLRAWASRVFESRAGEPDTGDLVDAVRHLENTSESFVDHERLSGLQILAQGGIGTSASVIGATVRILSEHRDLQDRVRSNPVLVPALIEESMRLEPPVPLMFRTAHRDIEVAGQHVTKGDKVGLFFGAANRDPAVFDRPDEVDIDRPNNRHLSFGAGVHRCVGSNLARLQIRVAVEQLLARLSPFWIPEGAKIEYASNQARGPSSVPLEFSPADPR